MNRKGMGPLTRVVTVLALPVILFPAALVWYLNIGGLHEAAVEARARRLPRKRRDRPHA